MKSRSRNLVVVDRLGGLYSVGAVSLDFVCNLFFFIAHFFGVATFFHERKKFLAWRRVEVHGERDLGAVVLEMTDLETKEVRWILPVATVH